MTEYEKWLSNVTDEKLKQELVSVKDSPSEVEDRFFKSIEFGTAGLRGKIGAGTNRMNVYTVGRVTRGVADYVLRHGKNRSVAIAYDSRNMSTEFARLVAEIMSANGIDAYLFKELMPTPVLSFAVRELSADCGVIITASHNPKEYNGYKVYNSCGCQITEESADEMVKLIEKHDYFETSTPCEEKIHLLGEEMLDKFIDRVLNYSVPFDKKYLPTIVYSPLNGTGNVPMQKLFAKMGVNSYVIVPEQQLPDGNFTTCPYPNPEEKDALALSLDLAKKKNFNLVIATDPDADRVGIAERQADGSFRLFTGNETGVLMENYILSVKKEKGTLPQNGYVVKTIVTSDLAEKIAESFGVGVKNVLTGFKYIGEAIDKYVSEQYLFGMEESYGYLVGTHVRDKDSVSAVMTIVEMYCYYASHGQSLTQALESLAKQHGFFEAKLFNKKFEGKTGMEFMAKYMDSLRKNPWSELAGNKVEQTLDYLQGIDGLPKSNVIVMKGKNFSAIVRPSGTEPKIKVYLTAKLGDKKSSIALLEQMYAEVENRFQN